MNIILNYIALLILAVDSSNALKWITEPKTIHICKGNNADFFWEFDEEVNKIRRLEWYLNNERICTSLNATELVVYPPFYGRIELFNKSGIRLKNVSVNDEGIYILFPVLEWSTIQNTQNITLQVIEPPANDCTCKIRWMGQTSKLACELAKTECGRPPIAAVWKRKETFEVLSENNSSSWFQDNEILCCPEGAAMKCVDDPRQACASVSIHDTANNGSIDLQTAPATTPARCVGDTECNSRNSVQVYSLTAIFLTGCTLIISFIVVIVIFKQKRMGRDNSRNGDLNARNLAKAPVNKRTNNNDRNHAIAKEMIPLKDRNDKDNRISDKTIAMVFTINRNDDDNRNNGKVNPVVPMINRNDDDNRINERVDAVDPMNKMKDEDDNTSNKSTEV